MERPADDPSLSAFERTARQIAEEERQLRLLAEERLRDFTRLALDFASVFLAAELDARTRADPYFLSRATAADWRSLIQAAQKRQQPPTVGWPAAQSGAGEADRWRVEAQRLAAEVVRLQDALDALAEQPDMDSGPALAPPDNASLAPALACEPTPVGPAQAGRLPALTKPTVAPNAPVAPWADVRLPAMPALAPGRFAGQLQNWPRESLALCALGVTGWSMRYALAELMSARLGGVRPNAGSLRRLFDNLAQGGFWHEQKLAVRGLQRPAAGADLPPTGREETTLILVRLTDLGREVLQACGVEPIPAEWDRLRTAHGGSAQTAHAGLVCTFPYHARRRGYNTSVCPEVAGLAAPDVQVTRPEGSLYVEVEDESGSSERRLHKWRNQAALQGCVALAAVTPLARTNLINEARAAGAAHGVATDLQTLVATQETGGPLWLVEW